MFYPYSSCNQFCSYSKYCIIYLFFNAETCTALYTCHCTASCIFFPRFHFHILSRQLCLTSSLFDLHFKLVKLIAQMYWYLYTMFFVFPSHSHNWPNPKYLKYETCFNTLAYKTVWYLKCFPELLFYNYPIF